MSFDGPDPTVLLIRELKLIASGFDHEKAWDATEARAARLIREQPQLASEVLAQAIYDLAALERWQERAHKNLRKAERRAEKAESLLEEVLERRSEDAS
ncbi:MAG: hypothetical protein J2P57_08825 [Acidimicrobiaceae bacterium]|nr:hypothetical protein [Acidimicrobiaceae bacterium]